MLIGISGYIGSGKDTVAKMIQYLDVLKRYQNKTDSNWTLNQLIQGDLALDNSLWQVKKFAGKLKEICSLLTGIPVSQFEQQSVKDSFLGPEWDYTHSGGATVPFPTDSKEAEYWKHSRYQMTVRELLQKMGTDAMRDRVHPNIHINALFADYKPINDRYNSKGRWRDTPDGMSTEYIEEPIWPNWIISDCRFPNEAQAIKDKGGIVIRVNRIYDRTLKWTKGEEIGPVSKDMLEQSRTKHSSETSLDNWKFDHTIENSGTLEELIGQVAVMLKENNLL